MAGRGVIFQIRFLISFLKVGSFGVVGLGIPSSLAKPSYSRHCINRNVACNAFRE